MFSYKLVKLLTVAASLYSVHHNILSRHKGQLAHKTGGDDLIVNHQTVADIYIKV